MSQVRIVLPWPSAALSPNGGHGHWAPQARAKKTYRAACRQIVEQIARGRKAMQVPLRVQLLFVPSTRRRRDIDNLVARMKAGLDGLADGLQVNDNLFRLEVLGIADPAPRGSEAHVVVTLSVVNETPIAAHGEARSTTKERR